MRPPSVTQMNRMVLPRPILQDLLYLAAACDREIHATRLTVDVAEFETGLADCRIVHDRQESRRIRHNGAVEQGFVVVEQIDEIDVTIKVGVFMPQLGQHASQL